MKSERRDSESERGEEWGETLAGTKAGDWALGILGPFFPRDVLRPEGCQEGERHAGGRVGV